MMKCPKCRSKLGRTDFLQGSCTSCGSPLLPKDSKRLAEELGIAAPAPPEVEAPKIQTTPLKIPDSVDCPKCGYPMMDDELEGWYTGRGCPDCGEENPNQGEPPAQESASAETPGSDEDEEVITDWGSKVNPTMPPTEVELIVNIGPMCGTTISIPEGIVGRDILSSALSDPWYHDHLARVSTEHFVIHGEAPGVGPHYLKDLGSTNGTFIDGKRIIGTIPTQFRPGTDLNIGRNLQFCLGEISERLVVQKDVTGMGRASLRNISVTHQESGVRFVLPFFLSSHRRIHLGRHRPTADSEDDPPQEMPWARMAKIQMTAMDDMDPKALNYISRNHLTLRITYNDDRDSWLIDADIPEGKAKPDGEIPREASSGDSFSFILSGNTFKVTLPQN